MKAKNTLDLFGILSLSSVKCATAQDEYKSVGNILTIGALLQMLSLTCHEQSISAIS